MMLRVDQFEVNGGVTLALAGVLDALGATELTRVIADLQCRKTLLTLNLCQLHYADRDGMTFLIVAARAGLQLVNVPAYIRTWLRHEGLALNDDACE
jgi:ABC-type transporter Mla MlaB component